MTKASDDKWQRYEQALLVAMGCGDFSASTTTGIQLLFVPAFHMPCCLRLVLADQRCEFSFALLMAHAPKLFDAVWREDAEAEAQAIDLACRSCLADITDLDAERAAIFRQNLADLDPVMVGDVDLAARDGISIRCDCFSQTRHHTFRMRSPTAQEAPRHLRLIALFLDAAQAHFHHPQIDSYLADVRRYLH